MYMAEALCLFVYADTPNVYNGVDIFGSVGNSVYGRRLPFTE